MPLCRRYAVDTTTWGGVVPGSLMAEVASACPRHALDIPVTGVGVDLAEVLTPALRDRPRGCPPRPRWRSGIRRARERPRLDDHRNDPVQPRHRPARHRLDADQRLRRRRDRPAPEAAAR